MADVTTVKKLSVPEDRFEALREPATHVGDVPGEVHRGLL